jgi:hypothetical protein
MEHLHVCTSIRLESCRVWRKPTAGYRSKSNDFLADDYSKLEYMRGANQLLGWLEGVLDECIGLLASFENRQTGLLPLCQLMRSDPERLLNRLHRQY